MSLFSSIQMAGNALQANQIALQVVGQNIANANTPGYIREEVELAPAAAQKYGNLLLGMGVDVKAVVQRLDKFLEERLRGAFSDQAGSQSLQETYAQLEGLIGELGDTDLSTSMNKFFSSIAEVLNQPENVSVRNLAVLQGETLAQDINRMSDKAEQLRADVNSRVQDMATSVNTLTEQVRVLNVRIAEAEGGNISQSDAVGLRDQRLQALEDLAKLINIRTYEQPNGTVSVYAGGDYLVYEGTARQVKVVMDKDRGLTVANLHIAETDLRLQPSSGELHGLLSARDDVLGGFLDKLDSLAGTLAFEFNKLYSSGQGLSGFQQMTGNFSVDDPGAALNAAGLKFTPGNGTFTVLVRNRKTGLTSSYDVRVDLNGMGRETTLADLQQALNTLGGSEAAGPLVADITVDNRLTIAAKTADQDFAFSNDTSGVLAALGLNTFFTGSTAGDLAVNADVQEDPGKFAASRGGIGADTANAVDLAGFLDRPLDSQNGQSLSLLYSRMTSEVTQGSSVAKAVADGAGTFATTLQGQKLAASGVNVDEEAVQMLGYQRAFQATARYISVLNDLFGVLVSL